MEKYKIFLTDSIEVLENEQLIGGANTYQEVCKTISNYLAVNKFHTDPYWRFVMNETATMIDYGSWSKFIAIVPPISMKELTGSDNT